MLFPFDGYLFDGPVPAASAMVAARSRRIREAARRYQPASVLQRAVDDGRLRRSPGPTVYRYRVVDASGPVVEGLVGEVRAGDLLPHESTLARLVEPAPPVEIRPILVVTRSPLGGRRPTEDGPVAVRGSRRDEVAAVPGMTRDGPATPLVIADGHHRVRATIESRGEDARIMALVVGDTGRGLSVGTFHRWFQPARRLPTAVADLFEVLPARRKTPRQGEILWAHGSGERWVLRPRPAALDRLPPALRRSPAAVAAECLYPLAGLDEDRATYVATVDTALARLGDQDAAILLPPAPMETVLEAAENGVPFPPKGTRFTPKPMRGLILRLAE